jgi:hypothetical protein
LPDAGKLVGALFVLGGLLAGCGDLATFAENDSSHLSGGDKLSQCRPTGCSRHLCADEELATTCEWRGEYACYQTARCERQTDGKCGWTMDDALASCLGKSPPVQDDCRKTGCSGHRCADRDLVTTCEWKDEYACSQAARCERQADGKCGFTRDADLVACLGK